jgi:hypothetical protein
MSQISFLHHASSENSAFTIANRNFGAVSRRPICSPTMPDRSRRKEHSMKSEPRLTVESRDGSEPYGVAGSVGSQHFLVDIYMSTDICLDICGQRCD